MNAQEAVVIRCPCCGEPVETLVDCSVPLQEYVEDCEVCCRPMTLRARVTGDGSVEVEVRREDE